MRLGVDLGGTKIEGIAIADDGREQLRRRVPAPRGDYGHTLSAIVELVHAIECEVGARGSVGIGIPGAVSPATQLIKNANSTWLIGRPLADDLARLLDRPIRIANDANCFALSEATDGAGAGAAIVFGVILGTGTGAGIVVHGKVLTGANAIGGEWGHNPLPAPTDGERPGPVCYCGRSGCIETFLSGPGLARDYERPEAGPKGPALRDPRSGSDSDSISRAWVPSDSPRDSDSMSDVERVLLDPPHPPTSTPVEIVVRADAGEPRALAALARYEERLARALAGVINILDPDVIVLGGGLSNIARLYESVPRLWTTHVFSDRVTTRLVRAMHGDSSGVRGAAWLWEVER